MLVDSHCHLNMLAEAKQQDGIDNVLTRANEVGVKYFLCVAVDFAHWSEIRQYAERYDNVWISVGVHPNETAASPTFEQLVEMASHPKVVAIGETGLDYFRSEGDVEWQRERFRTHIRAAKATKKPIIIHTREAREDTLKIMVEENAAEVGGVMHCFTETWDMAEKAIAMNFMISFSGIVTVKTAKELQDVARKVPLDKMLVETDCPYLAPVPYRGKPNEPAYVHHVAQFIADLREIDYAEVAEQTTQNFAKLFQLENQIK